MSGKQKKGAVLLGFSAITRHQNGSKLLGFGDELVTSSNLVVPTTSSVPTI